MVKRICKAFSSVPATVISGAFLMCELVFKLPFHPIWATIVISGTPLLYSAVRKLMVNKGISRISSALLITIAMIAAVAIGDLFAAGEVAFIMAIGEILEELTTARAKRGLKKLISLAPAKARVIRNGQTTEVSADEVCVGDVLRILPGEVIPQDGVIISGETSVDQAIMTGESIPVDKAVGDSVFCGTVNRFGAVDIEVTRIGEDSSLGKLIRLVKEAEEKQAPMARTADKYASLLVPTALITAIIVGLVSGDIVRAVAVLVVFCPCALVLATPTAIMAAIGQGTKHGVIIKSGEALEKMGRVDAVAFDKTGTLTFGTLEVSDVVVLDEAVSRKELISLVASAEMKSEHPIGKAIVSFAKSEGAVISECEEFKMLPGKGVSAKIEGVRIICGNEKLMSESRAALPSEMSKLANEGKAIVLVARDNACVGVIALSDVLRPEACKVVRELEKMRVKTVLLTGDNKQAAEYFAKKVGISEVRAELLPEQKVESIQKLSGEVCMIGDGVNDAPALKSASVGIAMGKLGSDIAVEAADVALMSDDLSRLPYLKRLARAALKTIKLSVSISMTINIAAVALSALGLLNPTSGALVHNAGSCLVILFAAMLYDRRFV